MSAWQGCDAKTILARDLKISTLLPVKVATQLEVMWWGCGKEYALKPAGIEGWFHRSERHDEGLLPTRMALAADRIGRSTSEMPGAIPRSATGSVFDGVCQDQLSLGVPGVCLGVAGSGWQASMTIPDALALGLSGSN